MTFAYTVRAEFQDLSLRAEYLAWLRDGHAAAVVAGGAQRAEVLDVSDGAVEARYWFAAEADFQAYLAGPAEALRADGASRFPLGATILLTRSTGTVVGTA